MVECKYRVIGTVTNSFRSQSKHLLQWDKSILLQAADLLSERWCCYTNTHNNYPNTYAWSDPNIPVRPDITFFEALNTTKRRSKRICWKFFFFFSCEFIWLSDCKWQELCFRCARCLCMFFLSFVWALCATWFSDLALYFIRLAL